MDREHHGGHFSAGVGKRPFNGPAGQRRATVVALDELRVLQVLGETDAQSSLRLAMSLCLELVAPESLGSPNVPTLRRLSASQQQHDDRLAVLAAFH